MSGFAGMVSLDGAPPDTRLLERMAEKLAFRGPDGTHITKKPEAGFCFTFLRTGPAPQCPSQPCSLDGRVWLLGDVRLDGRDDLRRKLEQHGDEFGSDVSVTDEELVLRAWRCWGEEGLPDLIGDYAFALWDTEARRLWCARDLMGARPFFYAQAGGWFYFSNTLGAIRCAPDVSRELDHRFIGDFLLQGSCADAARTAFRDIARLPAGHLLRHSHDETNILRLVSLPHGEPLSLKREEQYVELFRDLLIQAVADRLPEDSAAIYMSGGLDSTSVAALAVACARQCTQPSSLHAYCVDCKPLFDDDEGRLAALVAQRLSLPITIWSQSSCLPFKGWDGGRFTPEPSQEPYLPSYLEQSRCVSRRSRVVLTGYGGDGILTGQSWPYLLYLARGRRFATIGKIFGKYFVKHGRIPPLRGGFRARLHPFRRTDVMADYPEWLSPDFEMEMRLRERWCELMMPAEKTHPWYPDAHALLNGGYWPEILEREDAEWSNAPLESRAPLLDRRLIDFLLRVPPVPLCIDKELLRRAMAGLLPEEVRSRPKVPLAGDPLALQVRNGSWRPLPLPQPTPAIRSFVDWGRLSEILEHTSGDSWWRDLRPRLLHHWLQGIEKQAGIQ